MCLLTASVPERAALEDALRLLTRQIPLVERIAVMSCVTGLYYALGSKVDSMVCLTSLVGIVAVRWWRANRRQGGLSI